MKNSEEPFAKEWSNKNSCEIDTVGKTSRDLWWWAGECGHSWQASMRSRKRKQGLCPYCNNKKCLPGFNDLATTHPAIVSEWDNSNSSSPYDFLAGSDEKILWVCNKEHKWLASIYKRAKQGTGCPVCSNQKVQAGYNDLNTLAPSLAQEWDKERNSVDASEVGVNSSEIFWWVCSNGHSWKTSPNSRFQAKSGCSECSRQARDASYISNNGSSFTDLSAGLVPQWDYNRNTIKPDDVSYGSEKKVWWVCPAEHSWSAMVRDISRGKGCPVCAKTSQASSGEKELLSYVKNITSYEVIASDRSALPSGRELDIYIPSMSIAVEYNGLYWHSKKDSTYHEDKWRECKDNGIVLFQVWEDDWRERKDIVKRMIAVKLNSSVLPKVGARQLIIDDSVNAEEASSFLMKNHIQGPASGSIRYGLRDGDGSLLALVVMKRLGSSVSLERFATSTIVQGGFSKLVRNVERDNPWVERIVTFSDNTVSDGSLYRSHGFREAETLKADYCYVVKGRREHKFNYRIKRFIRDDVLQYREGLTERQLAELNNLPRLWDAGKIKWIKEQVRT